METSLPTPMTARVELLIYQRVYPFAARCRTMSPAGRYQHLRPAGTTIADGTSRLLTFELRNIWGWVEAWDFP